MRKSREVPLTLLTAVALASIGCEDRQVHCVDAQNRLASETLCEQQQSKPGSTGSPGAYHYVSGGSSGGNVGDTVVGASETSVSRGGFGHADGGDGGGHGGGEGAGE